MFFNIISYYYLFKMSLFLKIRIIKFQEKCHFFFRKEKNMIVDVTFYLQFIFSQLCLIINYIYLLYL